MKKLTFEELITEVHKYKPVISRYDEELLSLAHLIMTDQTDKIEENSDCNVLSLDNTNTVSAGKNYGINVIKLSDKLKKFGVKNIGGLNTIEEEFVKNAEVIDISSEADANKVYNVLNLANTTPLYKIIVRKKDSEYSMYLYNISGANILFGWHGWEFIKMYHVLPSHTFVNTIVIDATQNKNSYIKTVVIE